MDFVRGTKNYDSGLFGFGADYYCDPHWPVDKLPIFLKVTIRPAPTWLTIGLTFEHDKYSWSGSSISRDKAVQQLHEHIHAEVGGLAAYLREVYGLPEIPTIGSNV